MYCERFAGLQSVVARKKVVGVLPSLRTYMVWFLVEAGSRLPQSR